VPCWHPPQHLQVLQQLLALTSLTHMHKSQLALLQDHNLV
jgi:hypothetical protein